MANEWDEFEPVEVFPVTYYTPGKGKPSMEGGFETSTGAPMTTREMLQRGESDYATIAVGPKTKHLMGRELTFTFPNGQTLKGKATDYGPGVKTFDIATENAPWGKSAPQNLSSALVTVDATTADEWSGFEEPGAPKEKAQPKVSKMPTEVEADTAPKAVAVKPWYEGAIDAIKKGDVGKAVEHFDLAAQEGVRRALNLPMHGQVSFKDVGESGSEAFEPGVTFPEARPSRETVEKSLKTPVGDLSKVPFAADTAQAIAEMPADMAEFFTSPGGVASMGVGMLPKIAQALVGAGFTTQQIYGALNAPDNVSRIKNMLFGALGVKGTFDVLKGGVKPDAEKARGQTEETGSKTQELVAGPKEGVHLRDTSQDRVETKPREVAESPKGVVQTEPEKVIPFDEWGDFDEPTAEEHARIQAGHEADLMAEFEEHQARGGDELLDVLKQFGIPALSSKYSNQFAGEWVGIREMFKGKSGFATLVNPIGEKIQYKDIFRNDAQGDLDGLTQHLRNRGFEVDHISDTLKLIHDRLFTGRKIWGDEVKGHLSSHDLPESAFPNVGAVAGQPLGFIPVDWLWKFGQRLNEYRKGFQALIRARPTRDLVAATYDRIDNDAAIAGDHAGNEARILVGGRQRDFRMRTGLPTYKEPKPTLDEQAVIPVIEAWAGHGGAAGTPLFPITINQARVKMIRDAQKVLNSSKASPELKRVYKYASDNFDRLAAKKPAIDKIHERQLNAERRHGIDTDDVNGYVAHRFDMDLFNHGKGVILDSTGGKGGSTSYFMKQRVFPDYATAIAAGYVPKKFDIASLVNNRVRAGQVKINQRQWLDALRKEHDPISGKPLVADMIKQPKGTEVAPAGYTAMEPFAGQRVAINEYFAPLMRAMTGETHFPKAASKIEAGIKHGILLFDTFHLSRLAQMQTALMGKTSYRHGLSLLEYSDRMLDEAVKRNEITQSMADYSRKNRGDFNGLVEHGLNAGQITDALYRDIVHNVPVAGKFTDFLFSKFNRGIIAESGLYMLDRNRRMYPDMSERELFRKSAKETNVYYRNLRSQGIFKRRTWQDAARFFTLAPQWYEGMVTSELMGYGQLLKAPYDAVTKQKFMAGNIAKGMGSGIVAYMVGTQLINMLTRGHPTWENPEEGEKWSAWVPDFLGDSNGFFLNPLGVFAEMSHDIMKYSKLYPNKIDVVSKIAQNKFSPVSRALRDVFLGKDFFGRPLESVSDRALQAGVDLLPIPIGARSMSQQYAGSQERTLSSSLGFKLDIAPSAARQISLLAKDFNREHNVKVHDPYPSEYRELRDALKDGNMDAAQKEYDKLRKKKTPALIRRYFDKISKATFTGSKSRESQFRRSLERSQLDIYNQAVEDAKSLRQRFYQLER